MSSSWWTFHSRCYTACIEATSTHLGTALKDSVFNRLLAESWGQIIDAIRWNIRDGFFLLECRGLVKGFIRPRCELERTVPVLRMRRVTRKGGMAL